MLMDRVFLHKSGNILGTVGCEEKEESYPADFCETGDFYVGYPVDKKTHLAQKRRIKLSKNEWKPVFLPGDAVLSVHIPSKGVFNSENCERSYQKAQEIFRNYFPEYCFKAFVTDTWFLAPELPQFKKKTSNIINFRRKYYIFPGENASGMGVFVFVFNMLPNSMEEIDFTVLPEETSLQRSIKEHYCNANYIREFAGFFLM